MMLWFSVNDCVSAAEDEEFNEGLILPPLVIQLRKILDQYSDETQIFKVCRYFVAVVLIEYRCLNCGTSLQIAAVFEHSADMPDSFCWVGFHSINCVFRLVLHCFICATVTTSSVCLPFMQA